MSLVTAEEHRVTADRGRQAHRGAGGGGEFGQRAPGGEILSRLVDGSVQATSASVDLIGASVLSALNRVKNPNQTSWVVGAVVPLCHPVTDAGFNLRSRIGTNVPTPFTVRRNASKFPDQRFR
jgi:hypothetical protein